jgi:hypothetical protein
MGKKKEIQDKCYKAQTFLASWNSFNNSGEEASIVFLYLLHASIVLES